MELKYILFRKLPVHEISLCILCVKITRNNNIAIRGKRIAP